MKNVLLAFVLVLINPRVKAAQLNIRLQLDISFSPEKLKVYFVDGPVHKFLSPEFHNGTAVISEQFNSTYAFLNFSYPNDLNILEGKGFLVNEQTQLISFKAAPAKSNKMSDCNFKNAIDIAANEETRRLNFYTRSTGLKVKKLENLYNVTSSDSVLGLYNAADEELALKELEYIKKHSGKYINFWTFTQRSVDMLKKNHLAEVYNVFNSSFSEEFKATYEGKIAKEKLEGILFVKAGTKCPAFKTTDITGREISSAALKGKFFLLSFWATWCGPCVQEIPLLLDIRKKYSPEFLQMISISHDKDLGSLKAGVAKNTK